MALYAMTLREHWLVVRPGSKSKRPWPSYTDLWGGMALLTGLTAALVGVIAWRMGWLGY